MPRQFGSTYYDSQASRLKEAAANLGQLIAQIGYENGCVSWSRETVLARQKLDEAFMWAMKGIAEAEAKQRLSPPGRPDQR